MDGIKFEAIRKVSDVKFRYKDLKNLSKLDSTSPPSVFVGSGLKYPKVNVGILSPLERYKDSWIYDDAKYWANNDFGIGDVLKMREGLLNSRFPSKVKEVRNQGNRFVDVAKQIAIASNPVDVELKLKKNLDLDKKKDRVLTFTGMKAPLEKARISDNVKVSRKVDKVVNDDLKASQGMEILYKNNFDEYTLSKILSVGVLGMNKNKRLVPTRWSITATDDVISKQILDRVRDYKWIEDHEFFFGEFLGNQYLIMLFPNAWSFELFELYLPGSSWNSSEGIKASTDMEWFSGRKSYALNTAGGYYATRLPILEYLDKIKRQASVLVVRLETRSYWAALGVWVVRESVRKALSNSKEVFEDKESLIKHSKNISKMKFDFDPSEIFSSSRLLKHVSTQSHLGKWF